MFVVLHKETKSFASGIIRKVVLAWFILFSTIFFHPLQGPLKQRNTLSSKPDIHFHSTLQYKISICVKRVEAQMGDLIVYLLKQVVSKTQEFEKYFWKLSNTEENEELPKKVPKDCRSLRNPYCFKLMKTENKHQNVQPKEETKWLSMSENHLHFYTNLRCVWTTVKDITVWMLAFQY